MTKLEKHIKEVALSFMPQLEERVKKIKTNCKIITLPFFCDCCFDQIVYNVKKKKFTHIIYRKGLGKGITLEGIEKAGFFDKTKRIKFKI